jgi:hypothetical protein
MDEVAGAGEDRTMRSFITCALHQVASGWSNQGGFLGSKGGGCGLDSAGSR